MRFSVSRSNHGSGREMGHPRIKGDRDLRIRRKVPSEYSSLLVSAVSAIRSLLFK